MTNKLLSDEELGELVDIARKSLVDGDTNRQKLTNDEFKFYVLDLINTQKRLYAEMVIGEDETDNGYDKIIERMIKDKQRARIK